LILSSYHAGVEIQTLDGRSCIPGRPASAVAIRQQIDCYRLIPAAIDLLEHRRAIITRQRRLPEELRKGGAWSGHADGKIAILAGADRTVAPFGGQRIGLLVAGQQQRNPRVGILRRRHKLTAADDETTEIVIIARVLKGDVTLAIHIPRITKLVGGIVL